MNTFYTVMEVIASIVENLMILGIICRIGGKKYNKGVHAICMFALVGFLTIVVSVLNSISMFSFYTIYIGIFLIVFSTRYLTKGSLLLRTTACILAFFFLHSFDYIVGFLTATLMDPFSGNLYENFTILVQPGTTRLIYIVANKVTQIALFFLLNPLYSKIGKLNRIHQSILLVFSVCAYATTSSLMGMIVTNSLVIMQTAVIVTWVFIMLCLTAVIAAIIINSRYQSQKSENEMMSLTNDLMEKNYVQLHRQQTQIAKQLHDFRNHLKTIDHLTPAETPAKEYLSNLLSSASKPLQLCQSGNQIIDAVINSKHEEAMQSEIPFAYQIRLSDEPLKITSTDLCALLANQIDNAIEACRKIEAHEQRNISVSIWRRESFIFFKVVNSSAENPLDEHHNIKSSASAKGALHGFGIKNIKDIALRYNGTLEMDYSNGEFTSLVILQSLE